MPPDVAAQKPKRWDDRFDDVCAGLLERIDIARANGQASDAEGFARAWAALVEAHPKKERPA